MFLLFVTIINSDLKCENQKCFPLAFVLNPQCVQLNRLHTRRVWVSTFWRGVPYLGTRRSRHRRTVRGGIWKNILWGNQSKKVFKVSVQNFGEAQKESERDYLIYVDDTIIVQS